ncbi:MAG: L,D-transpeptidase [Candidatus Sericytochromatia bacterium]|nr:L,D-transpeptidase [Candidatus Sericytochromatia bacterium]
MAPRGLGLLGLVVPLAAAGVLALLAPAEASAWLVCRPGALTGAVLRQALRRGESAAWVAVHHGVNPVRISRLGGGRLRVDTRRITPRFEAAVQGVVLNVPEAHAYLVHDGRLERDYPVAVSTPDRPVPVGLTRVVSKEKNPTWYVPASIQKEMASRGQPVRTEVPPGPANPLGPRWIGFWNGQFGMHGTNAPTSIKRYASHGCVRFRAADIKDLYDRIWIGTPIRVVYQPVLLAADARGVWLSAYPDIYEAGFDYRAAVRALARDAGALGRLDWRRVAAAIASRDGIVRDVSRQAGPKLPPPAPTAPPPEEAPGGAGSALPAAPSLGGPSTDSPAPADDPRPPLLETVPAEPPPEPLVTP